MAFFCRAAWRRLVQRSALASLANERCVHLRSFFVLSHCFLFFDICLKIIAMMIEVYKTVYDRVVDKIHDYLTSSWGILLTGVGFIGSFLAPVKYAFLAVGIAILIDMAFGIVSAAKQKKPILSAEARQNTFAKVLIYFGPLFVIFVLEGVFSGEAFYFTKLACVIAGGCELWSMLASALIIAPKMLFPKVLRLQLRGEVESKLGKNISNLLDREVDDDKVTKGNPEQ